MSKPKFGVNSTATKTSEKVSEQKMENNQTNASQTETKKFGVNAMSNAGSVEKNKATKVSNSAIFTQIFGTQDSKFWIIAYIYSILLYFITSSASIVGFLNLLLFPFALILISNLVMNFVKSQSFATWLDPMRVYRGSGGLVFMAIWYITKLLVCSIFWKFSIILGVIGIFLLVKDTTK